MHILVVEDERRVASFVKRALGENGYDVDLADTGKAALALAMGKSYDVVVLDIRLPDISGIQICRKLREGRVYAPILMLTARALVEDRVEGLDAGADDYLTKPFAIAELLARIRALCRRKIIGRVLEFADIQLDRQQRRVTRAGRIVSLTTKEFSLLEFLVSRAPDAVSRTEIIEHVWDMRFDPQTNLVEVYINRLRHKLSEQGEPKIVHTIHGIGYCLKRPE